MAMQFLHPKFLYALGLLAIPIIIHLFNLRKVVTVYFSNVRLLQALSITTKSYSKIKNWIVLLLRLLALFFLVLAFAQPILPPSKAQIIKTGTPVSIYLDNSFSMESDGAQGQLLEAGKRAAADIVSAYPPATRFQLLTNELLGSQQRLLTKDDFLRQLDEVHPAPEWRSLHQIMARQKSALLAQSNIGIAYILSDFQKANNTKSQVTDTGVNYFFIPLHPNTPSNISIDTCWFNSPVHRVGQPEQLHFKLHNFGDHLIENIPVRCEINAKARATAVFSLKPHAILDTFLTYTPLKSGIQQGLIELTDQPVRFDDKYYFSYSITTTYSVLEIGNSNNSSVFKLFGHDSITHYRFMHPDQVDYSQLYAANLVILNAPNNISDGMVSELRKYLQQGGSLFLIPPSTQTPTTSTPNTSTPTNTPTNSPNSNNPTTNNPNTNNPNTRGTSTSLASFNDALVALHLPTLGNADTNQTAISYLNLQSDFYAGVFGKVPQNMAFPKVKQYYTFHTNTLRSAETLLGLQNGHPFLTVFQLGKGKVYLCASPFINSWSEFQTNALFVPTLFQALFQSRAYNQLAYNIGQSSTVDLPNNTNAESATSLAFKQINGNFEAIAESLPLDGRLAIVIPQLTREAGNYNLLSGKDTIMGISLNFNRHESDLEVLSTEQLQQLVEQLKPIHCQVVDAPTGTLKAVVNEMALGTQLWKLCIIFVLVFLIAETLLQRFL